MKQLLNLDSAAFRKWYARNEVRKEGVVIPIAGCAPSGLVEDLVLPRSPIQLHGIGSRPRCSSWKTEFQVSRSMVAQVRATFVCDLDLKGRREEVKMLESDLALPNTIPTRVKMLLCEVSRSQSKCISGTAEVQTMIFIEVEQTHHSIMLGHKGVRPCKVCCR